MKKGKFTLFVCFFICNALCCMGQQDVRNSSLCREIEKQYFSGARTSCFIFEHLDRWYFVSIVLPEHYSNQNSFPFRREGNRTQESNYSSISESNVIDFFNTTKVKKYPDYTFSTKGIKNFRELTPIYETLDKNKKKFYKMPLIGTFQASTLGDASVYAKIISDNSDDDKPELQKIDNVKFEKRNTTPNNNKNNQKPNENKTVTLVVYGTANNENEAIKTALRSAIEQTYGTFVSANTQIVNDELTKDEIVSVTSGNIENYSLISSEKESDGKISVTIRATVSLGKLLQFAQSKGATAELAGETFMLNMKLRELNKKNESEALSHMFSKMLKICDLNLFDYTITPKEPKLITGQTNYFCIPVIVTMIPNQNYQNLIDEFTQTLGVLSMNKLEVEDYKNANITYYEPFGNNTGSRWDYPLFGGNSSSKSTIALRNDIFNYSKNKKNIFSILREKIIISSCSFSIKDNIGNASIPIKHIFITKSWDKLHHIDDFKCPYPIFVDNQDVKKEINPVTTFNVIVYGVNPSLNNKSPFPFLGKTKLETYFSMYENINSISKYGDIYAFGYNRHRVFGFNYDIFKLDKGKSYEFTIYLFYKGEDLSSLNSITIEPTNSSDIKTETFKIDE